MRSSSIVIDTELPFPLVARGKVRDVYDVGGDRLLLVATDRISAFDVVLPQPIPHKGEVLTQLTAWWLARMEDLTPHHLLSADADTIVRALPELAPTRAAWARRSMLVRRTAPVPIECVVRGYLSGSAWSEYRRGGTLAGEALPGGLQESQRLDLPVFSPATKAVSGHDENITFAEMGGRVGRELADELRRRSLAIYGRGRELAARAGINIADTKLEFGRLGTEVLLIDEVLTPDSSRFWPQETYAPGRGQPSLDKQPVRDFLEALVARGAWDKTPPAPDLPAEVVEATSARYREVFRRLTGFALEQFPTHSPEATPPAGASPASQAR
ncbi:MAG: phosphoribosylaminoimidazolesuccinocarboxamide synthase [Gemmatimonadetes bacterium]|nr:phosphoribosylaminoimidazolesuccinocarboxamide synthase [Gemmatimonadota bacterium]